MESHTAGPGETDRPEAPGRQCAVGTARGLILALALLLSAGESLTAQIGILGGYSRDSFGSFSNEDFEFADRSDGFHTGIFLDLRLGRFGIRPGVTYRRLPGAAILRATEDVTDVDIEIIELPLDLRLIAPLPVARPYVVGGAAVAFPSSARPAVNRALAGARIRLEVGLGLEWNLGFRLWPEIRYGRSIGGLVAIDPEGDSDIDTFSARIGISF